MHSGIAVVDDRVVVAHPGETTLLFYDREGSLRGTVDLDGLLEPHGYCVSADGIWIGDVGFKQRVSGPAVERELSPARVVLVDATGRIVNEIADPGSGWSPTAVAVVEESGDVWVADGYGENLVHRFDADGRLLRTLTGEEGAGRSSARTGS